MDITSLKTQATTIRDERERSANTATRVGRALLDTVNALEESATTIAAHTTDLATAKSDLATAKADITNFKAFYHGDLGNHASWTDAQSRLDLMATDGSQSGQYKVSVGGVPFIVIHANVNYTSKIFTQSIIGSAFINSQTATLQTSHGIAVNIFSRTYANSAWGSWTRLAAQSEVPTPQTACAGTNKNYIYQDIKDNKKYVLTGVGKAFQYGGQLKLRFKLWGCDNDGYDDGMSKTLDFPQVNSGADGAMDHSVYGRLMNHSIYVGTNTQNTVNINYTNFAASGSKSFSIGPATTAKAGCMTVAHVNALNSLSSHIVDLGDFPNEEEALRKLGQLGVCNNKDLVHAHLTYTIGSSSTKNTLILIQSIHDNYCRQFVFNKDKVVQRGLTFADDSLQEITLQEEWEFLFGDRLEWDTTGHRYVLSQFGKDYGHSMCDPIPFASTTNDGLMSKEDYALLQQIKTKLGL